MIGKTYIDGIDIYSTYGVFITRGGYNGLVTFPPLKKPDVNDWQEESGVEVDLTDLKLDTKEFSISFAAHRQLKVQDFILQLSDGAYHEFDLREIGQVITLRMTSQPSREIMQNLELFSLNFADDYPLADYTYAAPEASFPISQLGYAIGDKRLSDYGAWILQGTESEMRKAPSVKQNLLINNNSVAGVSYDPEAVTFQAKDVNINLSMMAASLEEFWKNYKALLYDLTKVGENSIYSELTEEEYLFYYKSARVSEFSPSGKKIWCDFSITITLTNFDLTPDLVLLCTEDGVFISTEDDFFINMEQLTF